MLLHGWRGDYCCCFSQFRATLTSPCMRAAQVRQWLLKDSKAEDIAQVVDAQHLAGFVKHAFTLAFHHLRRRSSYADGMRATLCAGGDTDTNAAIVGAMLGALWGLSGIPQGMARPVLAYSYPAEGQWPGHKRPEALRAAHTPELAEALFRAGQGVPG